MKRFFFAFIFFLPFQISLNVFPDSDIALSRIAVALLFLWWLASSLKAGRVNMPRGLSSALLFAFLCWSALTLFYAPQLNFALRKELFLLNFFPLLIMTPSFFSFDRDKQSFTDALMYSGLAISLVGIAQFLLPFFIGIEGVINFFTFLAPFIYGAHVAQSVTAFNSWLVNVQGQTFFRAIAFFPDPHIFAFYLAFITPLAFFSSQKRYRIFGIIFLIVLALTFSRAGYIGAIAAFSVYALLSEKRKVVVWALPAVLLFLFVTPVGSRLISSVNSNEGSGHARLAIWGQAAAIIKRHPFLGVGLGNYAFAVDAATDYRTPIYAHNLYLDIWAELGAVGLLLFLCAMLHALYACLILRKRHWMYNAIFVSIVWFSCQAFFDTPLFSVHILPLLLIFLILPDTIHATT